MRAAPPLAAKETGAATTFDHQPAAWTDGGAHSPPALAPTDSVAIVFREPGRGVVVLDPNNANESTKYTFQFTDQATGAVTTSCNRSQGAFLESECAFSTGNWSPHGAKQYPVADPDGKPVFWHESFTVGSGFGDSMIQWNMTGDLTTTLELSTIAKRVINGWTEQYFYSSISSYDAGTDTTTFTTHFGPGMSGYYDFAPWGAALGGGAEPSDFVFTSVSLITQELATWCHQTVAEWEDFSRSADNVSINAVSIMYTNTAAPLNRQGKRVQLQVPAGVPWELMMGCSGNWLANGNASLWQSLSEVPGAVVDDILEGAYSFIKPENASCYDRRATRPGPQAAWVAPPLLPAVPGNDYVILYTSISQTSGQDGYWTPVHTTEYETRDQTRERLFPGSGALTFMAAHDRLRGVPQHHTNSRHLFDILGNIAGPLLKPLLPVVGGALGGPGGMGLGAAAASLL